MLTAIAVVALDTRLGCLADDLPVDSEQQKLIRAANNIIDDMYHLDYRPSLWKYVSTPRWRQFVKNMDHFTE